MKDSIILKTNNKIEDFQNAINNSQIPGFGKSPHSMNTNYIQLQKTIVISELCKQINRFDNYQDNNTEINENKSYNKIPTDKILEVNESVKSDGIIGLDNSLCRFKLNKTKKTFGERVFWTEEKMDLIREKFRTASEKIKKKTEADFNELYSAIRYGERTKIL